SFAGLRFSPDGKRVAFATADRKAVRVLDVTADPPTAVADVPLPGELVTLEWHPAGSVLALGVRGPKSAVVLWDLADGKARAECDGPPPTTAAGMVSLGFSPDGRYLAVHGGRDPAVRVFGGLDGAERFRLADTTPFGVSRVVWTAAGELAVAGMLDKLRLWKPDPEPLADAVYRLWPASRPAFSPDGRWVAALASTSGARPVPAALGLARKAADRPKLDRVAVVDRRTGRVDRQLPGFDSADGNLQFSPDGRRVVLQQREEVLVRDAGTGAEVLRRPVPKAAGGQWLNAFHLPDGRLAGLVSVERKKGEARGLALWDVAADRSLHTFDRGGSPLGSMGVEVSADGSRIYLAPPIALPAFGPKPKEKEPAGGRLIQLPSGRVEGEVPPAPAEEGQFTAVARLTSGGRMLTLSMGFGGGNLSVENSYWTVRALPSGEELLRMPNRSMADHANDFGSDGRLVAVGSDHGQVEVWDVDAKALLFRYQPHGGKTVHYLAFAHDGDIATASDEDDRLVVLRMKEVRERLAEMGLGW
ncbi:MAG TPA: WD40 repeat domain-containing protein, partial [Gemmataceae bacterium]|nr:WD40 repeat domain-containing protein [Gemmataceae bacterium]